MGFFYIQSLDSVAWIQSLIFMWETFSGHHFSVSLVSAVAFCVTVDFSEIFLCENIVFMKGASNQLSEPFSFKLLCWHDWNFVVLGQITAACEQIQEELNPLGRWNPEPLDPQAAHFRLTTSDFQIAQCCISIWDFKVLLCCHIWEHYPK